MTRDEFEAEINKQCAYCARGTPVRYRPEVREWIHENRAGVGFSITICRANKFRNDNEGKDFSSG